MYSSRFDEDFKQWAHGLWGGVKGLVSGKGFFKGWGEVDDDYDREAAENTLKAILPLSELFPQLEKQLKDMEKALRDFLWNQQAAGGANSATPATPATGGAAAANPQDKYINDLEKLANSNLSSEEKKKELEGIFANAEKQLGNKNIRDELQNALQLKGIDVTKLGLETQAYHISWTVHDGNKIDEAFWASLFPKTAKKTWFS